MKILAIVWIAAVVTGIVTVNYVSNVLDTLIKPLAAYQLQEPAEIDLGNNACLQNCKPIQLQPAISIK